MDSDVTRQVEKLHSSPTMAGVAVTGGGAHALAWLLGVPGASRTVLEVVVPYAAFALCEFLGREVGQAVSARTTKDMARVAFNRAVRLRGGRGPVVGIGCTAAIATDRPKRGVHRCHVAAWDERGVSSYSLELVKGLRDRAGEDEIVSRLLLRALAEASSIEFDLSLELDNRERVKVSRTAHGHPLARLLAGELDSVVVSPGGRMAPGGTVRGGVLPGAFNPLHEGHRQLADVASTILGAEVVLELSITNVDKPPLEEGETRRRLAQLAGYRTVVLTRAPVFYEKARLFPGCPFVVGWDTAVRLVDPKYYGGSEARMVNALEEMRSTGCRVLVAGREVDGSFRTLADVGVPPGFEDMFTAIPPETLRYDVSSTELREAGQTRRAGAG